MAAPKTELADFVEAEIKKYEGIMVPVKASLSERMLTKKVPIEKLHPNPDDEFCSKKIGPNYSIYNRYVRAFQKFGTMERQQKFRQVLLNVIPKMDVDSGRDWVAVYIAYHFYIKRVFIMKGYADFFTDIERLLPGQLTKVKQEEPKGDKRYKSYTEALASECGNWFILDECLPEMAEWRSSKFNYRVDDNRRSRIQNLVKEVYQGLKDAES